MALDRVTTDTLGRMKQAGDPIVALTAYDWPTAEVEQAAGVDIILVGDSMGTVVFGHETTLKMTMDLMVAHCAAVARAEGRALLVGDMPFLSTTVSVEDAVRNAGRFIAEGNMHAVKVEGGVGMEATIAAIVRAGIPVMGHVGYTPQQALKFGRKVVRGRGEDAAAQIMRDAQAVERAGAFAIVLECVPLELAKRVTESVGIPTIGIGSGPHCDGQILVVHDMLGLFDRKQMKHVKRYADLKAQMRAAVEQYAKEVRTHAYPDDAHAFHDEGPGERQ
ncbi:MAG: 3-methyl-2-oxobutanoate hydroxymethyltransferase [Verrucomicrobia bacterium]|nr:3-methyl-2-oxobutanoate hydroxymethyltransferase [Verrucomicrobiota bacterium]